MPGEIIVIDKGEAKCSPSAKGWSDHGEPRRDCTNMAIAVEHIDELKKPARAKRLREKLSDEEIASTNASLARSLAQLRQAPPKVTMAAAARSRVPLLALMAASPALRRCRRSGARQELPPKLKSAPVTIGGEVII